MAAEPYAPAAPAGRLPDPVVVLADSEVNALSWLLLAAMSALDSHALGDPDAATALLMLDLTRQDLRDRQRAAHVHALALAEATLRLVPAGGGGRS